MPSLSAGRAAAVLCTALLPLLLAPLAQAAPVFQGFVDHGYVGQTDQARPGLGASVHWENGLGLEASGQQLAEFDVVVTSIGGDSSTVIINHADVHSTALALSYRHALGERLSASALLGAHHWRIDYDLGGDNSNLQATYGLRLDLRLSERWSTGLAYQQLKVGQFDVERSSLRVAWRF